MAKIIVTHPQIDECLENLRADHEVIGGKEFMSADELAEQIVDADALLSGLSDRWDAKMLSKAKNLKVIGQCAAGFNNIDMNAAKEAGIVVTTTPGVLHESTADLAFALLLSATRRMGEAERHVRARKPWRYDHTFMLGKCIQGATLGIIGLGQIGEAMARRGAAFGMNIIYTAHSDKDTTAIDSINPNTSPSQRVTTEELIARSDVISLHCPLTDETRHILDKDAFEKMKPGVYIVNTARGACIDERALVEALKSGKVAGAGLDVYENEPLIDEELYGMENVVLLPHIGSAATKTRINMTALAVENIELVLSGKEPKTPVAR